MFLILLWKKGLNRWEAIKYHAVEDTQGSVDALAHSSSAP